MAKEAATYVKCIEDEGAHNYLDACWMCAPHWYHIPTCPTHNRKLATSGYCKACKKFYQLTK